jgi:hypothetical protein
MENGIYPENYLKEDFIAESDEYLNVLELQKKRNLYLKIGMGTVYIFLFIAAVLIV